MPRGFQAILDAAQDMPSETQPIVLGRDLIALGMKPGKEMGVVLSALLELQLDGKFTTLEEGKRIAKEMINLHRP
jgi:tRNA nucleotidyltransferase (CCA-adding enzyme)